MAYPDANNLTDFGKMAVYMNTVTIGWFWTIILISWTITMFIFLNAFNKETAKNLHATLLTSFLVSLPMYGGGLITPYIMLFMFLLWALSAWYVRVARLP